MAIWGGVSGLAHTVPNRGGANVRPDPTWTGTQILSANRGNGMEYYPRPQQQLGQLGRFPTSAPVYGQPLPRLGNGNPYDRNQGLGPASSEYLRQGMNALVGPYSGRSLYGPGDWNLGGGMSEAAFAARNGTMPKSPAQMAAQQSQAAPPSSDVGSIMRNAFQQRLGYIPAGLSGFTPSTAPNPRALVPTSKLGYGGTGGGYAL